MIVFASLKLYYSRPPEVEVIGPTTGGPELSQATRVLAAWGKNKLVCWVTRSSDIRSYVITEAADSMVDQTPAVPFMAM